MQHRERMHWTARHPALMGFSVALLYGAIDELHQMFTIGRHPSVSDVLIDAAGAILFLAGLQFYRFLKRVNDAAY